MLKTSDTLYYDGSCPQCMREIRLLNYIKNDYLVLVNIHEIKSDSPVCLMDKNQLLSVLHLQTEQGDWLTGLDANVRAWQHTRAGWLLRPLRWPMINKFTDFVYAQWAKRRACRLGYVNNSIIPNRITD